MSEDTKWGSIKNLRTDKPGFPSFPTTYQDMRGLGGFFQLVKKLLEPCNCHTHFSTVSQRFILKSVVNILVLKIVNDDRQTKTIPPPTQGAQHHQIPSHSITVHSHIFQNPQKY